MEDFRTIFYVILAIIFVVSRILKANKPSKKTPPNRGKSSPNQAGNTPQGRRKAPTSFEDLLKEFAEEANEQERSTRKEEREPARAREVATTTRAVSKKPTFEEGKTRRFADDESRKI
ncbi:MAG: hypothetical protein AAFO69_14695, partial [Bacteroidota bacterium]